jgi:hypothetical protein
MTTPDWVQLLKPPVSYSEDDVTDFSVLSLLDFLPGCTWSLLNTYRFLHQEALYIPLAVPDRQIALHEVYPKHLFVRFLSVLTVTRDGNDPAVFMSSSLRFR